MRRLSQSKIKLKPSSSYSFSAIGTQWSITFDMQLAPSKLVELKRLIATRIELFDKNYSRFRQDSLITEIATKAGDYILPGDAKLMLDLYKKLYDISDGAVTPLIGQVLADAGYDANYSLKPKELSMPPAWNEALLYDFPKLTVNKPVLLDFGAAGKGYLVDLITQLLVDNGCYDFCVDASGDMAQKANDSTTLRVGLEHPSQSDQVIGVATIRNQSICGSAGNRRVWAGFNHIIDPRVLASPKHIKAVWVVADTTLVADALTTALYFVDPVKLAEHFLFDYAILAEDYSLQYSQNFPAEFFTPEDVLS